jgi:phosphoribosylformylglycinamidine synthase
MLFLDGPTAYSAFRLNKLAGAIAREVPALRSLCAHSIHLVLLEGHGNGGGLTPDEARKLDRLLDYGPRRPAAAPSGDTLIVTPRIGTRSPWSTKATEIVHRCGLQRIQRLERGVVWSLQGADATERFSDRELEVFSRHLHDPMTESVFRTRDDASRLLEQTAPAPLLTVPLLAQGRAALEKANVDWGLALSGEEMDYLVAQYRRLERDPTDVELMMFAQVNSEHCRHKIFNAHWTDRRCGS